MPTEDGLLFERTLSPDGRLLATRYSNDHGVFLWDALTGKSLRVLRGHNSAPCAFAFSRDGRNLVSASGDATALVWDISDLYAPRTVLRLTPTELAAAWTALGDMDARNAYQALLRLIAASDLAVSFIGQRLSPVAEPVDATVNELASKLDAPRFADREAATAALAILDMQAESTLRRLLAGNPAAEAKKRAELLLARLEGPLNHPERLRELRAVEVLEHIATPSARDLLTDLAKGAPGARLTVEAKASLERLKSK
jgi:hypothetical protein